MPRLPVVSLLVILLPPLVVGIAYDHWLGHRSDYLGHFLAGFGGTLGAVAVALALLSMALTEGNGTRPRTRPLATRSPGGETRNGVLADSRLAGWITFGVVLACIGLGAIFEETLYRVAKWDEVDFCNQSLGAVLAGLAALASFRNFASHQAFSHPFRTEQSDELDGNAALGSSLSWALATGCWGAIVLAGGYYFAFR